MNDDQSCCFHMAARNVKKIKIDGGMIGISKLENILAEVEAFGLTGEEIIKAELVRVTKIYNYVISKLEREYANSLYREYCQKLGKHH